MTMIYIYCEGPTEEKFIRDVLTPYLSNFQIYPIPIVCKTKRSDSIHRGGVSKYKKIKDELTKLAYEHPNDFITTMFDYYGLPIDTPGYKDSKTDPIKHAEHIESMVDKDIGHENCKFNLMVHEFETILFSKPEVFTYISDKTVEEVRAVSKMFKNPEYINNSVETAPSKRLMRIIDNYSKVSMGTILAGKIGMGNIMEKCPHFERWVKMLIDIGSKTIVSSE